ncbi:ead/Ea22-like family protein [Klebsiella pneumoniae]|uniref:Ead/Ea22-like family protein n=2 Tax=Klebsiella pneumoniae TaxID=573 RepID=A0AAW8AJ87_KLEPN|nr:ead/Ea22-like family protein [Klebsiella pneumoniae]MDP0968916.1 ead/Ea22-like family protein [Klebsiella pneumoniae]MEC7314568.1 ead/Ea22-like family protein [Klebsiella pneumoniae]MEC7319630.1 ead/Ea22-like family protein [Klebsiella pneumoniae]
MTDITELAQSLKAAAEKATPGEWRRASTQFNGITATPFMLGRKEVMIAGVSEKRDAEFIALANPANILALVEALEKAQRYIEELRDWNAGLAQESCERQQLISELEPIRAAAEKLVRCKGRYHSEQNYRALAALFGVNTPDLPPLEHENVHYGDTAEMEIEALRQRIAELESRTVKLPDLRQIVSGDRYVWSDGVYNYSQDVKVSLAAAGIKVKAE